MKRKPNDFQNTQKKSILIKILEINELSDI